ncbi:pimeloyl-ACP methyl ester carboxylesterase [Streptomyces puniciscabiei]|uniref:Pimeloyl-ACP methyl ester carboxylesterase n=1 Tax=Streptomyces puniciscabiei TaxID=164348 RepID=A0A542U9H0_9ACTN|nr:alpha/beta hydrolase [Streptomyces puniciscabiei]TQK95733.1 pimeloyl-ACP methyl ester carboxylesterase [Streptomyces puniciscabiei]
MTEPPHYDVTGSGRVLLVLPGGAGHPMGLGPLTERLAAYFTVVTYDPLGLAHGRLGLPVPEQRVADWSEGAHRVLEAVLPQGASAYVFGTSSGGIAALDLLARHPGRLAHVVAHEPPVVQLLPDADRQRAMFAEVAGTCRAAGLRAAGARLAAGLDGTPAPDPGEVQPPSAEEELSTPMGVFLTRVLLPFTAHVSDTTALRSVSARLTLGAGTGSRGRLLHRTAVTAAESTDGAFTEFPGGHLGALEHPAEFARCLVDALSPSGSRAAG